MKVLESIRLVQFFLYEKQDLAIGKVCGLFGANGSGKSSFIDAVQIAMMGGNTNNIAFNAQADEGRATTRSIRTYCLGQYGDGPEARVRDAANTYITLVWRDDTTGIPTTMGICISASADKDGHEILGRYLLPGADLALDDHLEIVDGKERPRQWETFRHALRERAKALGIEEVEFKDSSRFVRAVLMALRGSGAAPSPDAFTRAFRFGLKMRFDKQVDEIVRNQVLETRPTNIKKFKEVTESFRHLKELVEKVKLKIQQAEQVRDQFGVAASRAQEVVTWDSVIKRADWQSQIAQQSRVEGGLTTAKEALQAAKEEEAQQRIDKETAEENERNYRSLRDQHSTHRDHGQLQLLIEEKRTLVATGKSDLAASLSAIRTALDRAELNPKLRPADEVMDAVALALESLPSDFTDESPAQLRMALEKAIHPLVTAFGTINHERVRLDQEMEELVGEIAGLRENLERVAQGRAPLGGATRRLLTALSDAGLQGVPVCDLVRVTDPDWQPVIEAYLAPYLEAILVPQENESEALAYDVFVQTPNLAGAILVRGSRFAPELAPESGSLAELIQGEDPAAINFLRHHLRGLSRASSQTEAFSRGNRATADGLIVAGEIQQLPRIPFGQLKLGVGDTSTRRDSMVDEISKREGEKCLLHNRILLWKEYHEQFSGFAVPELVITRLVGLCQQIVTTEAAVGSLTKRLVGSADAEYVHLGELVEKWATAATNTRATHLTAHTAMAMATKAAEDAAIDVERAAVTVSDMKQRYDEVMATPDFDEPDASHAWHDAIRTNKNDFALIARQAVPLREEARKQFDAAIKRGSSKLIEFNLSHRENISADIQDDWRKSAEWVINHIQTLTDTELHNYQAQMEEAYLTSRATFRTDVATRLKEHLDWLDATMERLNKVLKSCPLFSNGERYRFLRNLRPEHKELHRFILDVSEWGSHEDLLGAGEMPETFRQLMDDASSSTTAMQHGPLDDYREFYDFDIQIEREDAAGKSSIIGRLSKRVGSGSGGEHRAPLYVIAGAALASAYHLDGGARDGLGLIVLDEAFNKMDPNNIIATMRYLTDLGLQVFMASPGENLGTITAFLDRYFDVVRDADNNVVLLEGHDITEATREMFRADLLEFHPELLAQEIETMRTEKAAVVGEA